MALKRRLKEAPPAEAKRQPKEAAQTGHRNLSARRRMFWCVAQRKSGNPFAGGKSPIETISGHACFTRMIP
jgi:hypothetical protein